jgi:hypothetical protein
MWRIVAGCGRGVRRFVHAVVYREYVAKLSTRRDIIPAFTPANGDTRIDSTC